MEAIQGRALSFKQKFSYSAAEMGVSLSPAVVAGWLVYYYSGCEDPSAALVAVSAIGVMTFFGRLGEVLSNPLIGYLSDRVVTRWGRRIPWIAAGAPLMTVMFLLMWFPPFGRQTLANGLWLAVSFFAFWVSYVAVCAPYLSLLPEITPYNDERISLSMWMAFFDVGAYVLATGGVGFVIEEMKDANLAIFGFTLDRFRMVALCVSLITLVFCLAPILFIREKPHSAAKEVPFKFFKAFAECFKNRTFLPYVLSVAFFRISIDTVVAVIPFLITRLLGRSELHAAMLQLVVILIAALLFPAVEKLSNKYGKKMIYSIGMLGFSVMLPLVFLGNHAPFLGKFFAPAAAAVIGLFGEAPSGDGFVRIVHMTATFMICAFFISTFFVLPRAIFADVIDQDEVLTGYRREAMYNGMEGLIHKFAAALTPLIYTQLFAIFGDSADRPLGILLAFPVAGAFLFVGFLAFLKYPLRK